MSNSGAIPLLPAKEGQIVEGLGKYQYVRSECLYCTRVAGLWAEGVAFFSVRRGSRVEACLSRGGVYVCVYEVVMKRCVT